MVFLFSPQCQLVVMLALYTTSHGQSKGPKMVARGQCRRANGGQKRLAKTLDIIEPETIELDIIEPETIELDTIDIVVLRRGIIGVNKIGYVT